MGVGGIDAGVWLGSFATRRGNRMVAPILLSSRLLALTMIGTVAVVAAQQGLLDFQAFQGWWCLTLVVAGVFSWLQFVVPERLAAAVPLAEAVAAFGIVAASSADAWPLVAYLVVTPAFLGIAARGFMPLLVPVAQLGVLMVIWALNPNADGGPHPAAMLSVVLVSLFFGLVTMLVQRLAARHWGDRPSDYAQALDLLEQLSDITRQLPVGLGLDAAMLESRDELMGALGAEDVALFMKRGTQWTLECGPPAAAALTQDPAFEQAILDGGCGPIKGLQRVEGEPWLCPDRVRILPLVASGKLRAVAVARFAARPSHRAKSERCRQIAEDAAARVAAANVYGEVRERATAEERRRVSREIHDGIAQDLAALTYRLSNIAAETGLEPIDEAAEEVRRLVRELRLSIFDLRTGLTGNQALGTAIGDYAQQVASSTGVVVHTTVSEHGVPLDANMQHELLRVCQEAVANARRHARARNMWITYKNYGGGWLLRVADDGIGVADKPGRSPMGGEGMAIMRERVNRMGAQMQLRRRIGGGTVLEVTYERGSRVGERDSDSQWRDVLSSV